MNIKTKKIILIMVILVFTVCAVGFVYQDYLEYEANYQRQMEQIRQDEMKRDDVLSGLEKLK